jgi:predicted RNA-binding Zn ribbon-like protein
MAPVDRPKPFKWVGGNLALDFTNTVDWDGEVPIEGDLLPTFDRLAAWSREAGLLSDAEEVRLNAQEPEQQAKTGALERAWELRSTIHAVFAAVAHGNAPAAQPLRRLNQFLVDVPARVAVESPAPTFAWTWPIAGDRADGMLPPIAWSAARLLTSADLAHLSICANDSCGWLFIDTSRRHNRKWCEMGVCGNRAKARRFQARQRKA